MMMNELLSLQMLDETDLEGDFGSWVSIGCATNNSGISLVCW